MRKMTTISIVLASVLCSTVILSAKGMTVAVDSVAKKEASALVNPKMTEGEHAAKAKVEETAAKEEFKTKEDMGKLEKEALSDEKKVDDVTKVKELEAKDQAVAKKKVKAFSKEAVSDEKKTVK